MTPTISFKSILFGMAKLLVPTLLFIVTTSILQGIVFFLLGIPFTDRLSYGSIPPLQNILIEAAGLIPVFTLFIVYKKRLAAGFNRIQTGRRYAVAFSKAFLFALMLITACSLPILLFNGIDVYLNHALDPINIGFTLVFFILAALAEEILCRVVFLGLLVEKYGEWNSLIASSLLFMALHFLNPNVTPVAAINLFLAGILLGQVFLYSGKNLLFATIFHMGWNFTQGSLFGFSVSGMAIGQSLLIQQAPAGSAWSGKNFGLEGSVECTVVLILAISLLSWRQSKRAHSGTAQEPDTLLFTRGPEKAELAGRQYPQDRTLR